jgi:hypothetical protein
LYISGREKEKEDRVLELCDDCLQVGNNQEDSQEDCRKKLKHSGLQSDNNSFPGGQIDNKMATEGHRCAGRKDPELMRKLKGMKNSLRSGQGWMNLQFEMQQDAKSRWVYEWPMRTKEKWPVKELMAKRQQRLLRGWLRHAENLNGPEEVVQVCEPETGRNLSDAEDEWDQLKISRTARRAAQKFPIARREKS